MAFSDPTAHFRYESCGAFPAFLLPRASDFLLLRGALFLVALRSGTAHAPFSSICTCLQPPLLSFRCSVLFFELFHTLFITLISFLYTFAPMDHYSDVDLFGNPRAQIGQSGHGSPVYDDYRPHSYVACGLHLLDLGGWEKDTSTSISPIPTACLSR